MMYIFTGITDEPRIVSDSVYSFLKDMLISVLAVIGCHDDYVAHAGGVCGATSFPLPFLFSIGILYVLGFEINTVTLASLL